MIPRSVLLWMRSVSGKSCRETRNTHCTVTFFQKSCRLWDNLEKYCRAGQTTDDNMAHAHCMLNTWGYKHTQYVILIALPLRQWLHERASMLRYTYSVLLVLSCILEVPDSIRDQDAKFVTEFSRDLQQVMIAYCPSGRAHSELLLSFACHDPRACVVRPCIKPVVKVK